MTTRILCAPDLHQGSNDSIMPRKVAESVNGSKREHRPTDLQSELNDAWDEMKKKLGRIDVVLAAGDLCEGPNKKEYGLGNWTTNLSLQVDCAVELLAGLKAKVYAVTEGSGYHVGENPSLDHQVAKRLEDTTDATVEYGPDLAVNIREEDYRIHVCHVVGTSYSPYYRSTPIAIELMAARLNEKEYGRFDALIRGHAHYYVYLEYGHQWGAIVPGWKRKDAYLKKKGLRYTTKPGWYAFELDHGKVSHRWKETVESDSDGYVQEVRV